MKEIVLDLICELNEAEVNDRAQQLSSALQRYDEVEIEKKNSAKKYADLLGELGGQTRKLSGVIRRRAEVRPVFCAVMFNSPTNGTKRTVRKDTGEIVKDEPMSSAEMQNNLFGESDGLVSQDAVVDALSDLVQPVSEGVLESVSMKVGDSTFVIDKAGADRISKKARDKKK